MALDLGELCYAYRFQNNRNKQSATSLQGCKIQVKNVFVRRGVLCLNSFCAKLIGGMTEVNAKPTLPTVSSAPLPVPPIPPISTAVANNNSYTSSVPYPVVNNNHNNTSSMININSNNHSSSYNDSYNKTSSSSSTVPLTHPLSSSFPSSSSSNTTSSSLPFSYSNPIQVPSSYSSSTMTTSSSTSYGSSSFIKSIDLPLTNSNNSQQQQRMNSLITIDDDNNDDQLGTPLVEEEVEYGVAKKTMKNNSNKGTILTTRETILLGSADAKDYPVDLVGDDHGDEPGMYNDGADEFLHPPVAPLPLDPNPDYSMDDHQFDPFMPDDYYPMEQEEEETQLPQEQPQLSKKPQSQLQPAQQNKSQPMIIIDVDDDETRLEEPNTMNAFHSIEKTGSELNHHRNSTANSSGGASDVQSGGKNDRFSTGAVFSLLDLIVGNNRPPPTPFASSQPPQETETRNGREEREEEEESQEGPFTSSSYFQTQQHQQPRSSFVLNTNRVIDTKPSTIEKKETQEREDNTTPYQDFIDMDDNDHSNMTPEIVLNTTRLSNSSSSATQRKSSSSSSSFPSSYSVPTLSVNNLSFSTIPQILSGRPFSSSFSSSPSSYLIHAFIRKVYAFNSDLVSYDILIDIDDGYSCVPAILQGFPCEKNGKQRTDWNETEMDDAEDEEERESAGLMRRLKYFNGYLVCRRIAGLKEKNEICSKLPEAKKSDFELVMQLPRGSDKFSSINLCSELIG
jgi:hypothetical protein